MKIFRNFTNANNIRNPVVTTGSFDGVHIGHKTILNRLKLLASKYDGESVLITFDPHPRKVLYPDTAGKDLKLITSHEEKIELLEKSGLDNMVIVDFTREFSKITSEQFVRDYLHGMLHAKVVVVGFNHHFGFNKEGDYRQLWNWQQLYDFEAEEIPEQEVYHETVSSTQIRKAISEGYIQRANAYLDHYYLIKGQPVDYNPPFATDILRLLRIMITEECKLLPPPGIYAASVENGHSNSKGMVIIHVSPDRRPEVLLYLYDHDSYDNRNLTIYFHKKIHGAVNLSEPVDATKLHNAKDEISELIY